MDQGNCAGCGLANACICDRDEVELLAGACPDCGGPAHLNRRRSGAYVAGCCAAFAGRYPFEAVRLWADHLRECAKRSPTERKACA